MKHRIVAAAAVVLALSLAGCAALSANYAVEGVDLPRSPRLERPWVGDRVPVVVVNQDATPSGFPDGGFGDELARVITKELTAAYPGALAIAVGGEVPAGARAGVRLEIVRAAVAFHLGTYTATIAVVPEAFGADRGALGAFRPVEATVKEWNWWGYASRDEALAKAVRAVVPALVDAMQGPLVAVGDLRRRQASGRPAPAPAAAPASRPAAKRAAPAPPPASPPRPAAAPTAPRSDVDAPPSAGRPNPDAVAVVVGIERYAGPIPPVAFARRDAETFKRYLVHALGYREENVLTLLDGQATAAAVRTAIEGKLPNLVTPGRSDVTVYFAGHGAPDLKTRMPFLVPFDGDPAYPATSCYPLRDAYAALGRLGARSVNVIVDSCFSGASGRGVGVDALVDGARPLSIEAKAAPVPDGLVVFAAADGNQVSSTLRREGHGIFTYYYLKGLAGAADLDRDGAITVDEMARYVKPAVAAEARRLNREQTPVVLGEDGRRVLLRR